MRRRHLRGTSIIGALLATLLCSVAEARTLNGVALSIGQSDYETIADLENTGRDARGIENLLDRLGFSTDVATDRDARQLRRDLDAFVEDAGDADVAVLYYAGHAVEIAGENYLLSTDVDTSSPDALAAGLVPLAQTVGALRAKARLVIVLLDACRDNPLPPGMSVRLLPDGALQPVAIVGAGTRGASVLARQSDPASGNLGMVLGFAAEPGKTALDGEPGGNSPYAAALLRHLSAMSGEEFGTVMRMVTQEVYLKTAGRQRPWVNESLQQLLYFGEPAPEPTGDEAGILKERRQLLLTIAALPDAERRQVERVAAEGGVPMDALYGMLSALGTDVPDDPAELENLLRAQTGRVAGMIAERSALAAADPEIVRLAALAETAMDDGALLAAQGFFDRAKLRIEELGRTVDQAETDIRARRLEFAAVFARSAEAGAIAFDYRSAADDFERAYVQARRWDDGQAWRYRDSQAAALLTLGDYRGDTAALAGAVEISRDALELARQLADPQKLVASRITLGNALSTYGERGGDIGLVRDAVAVFGDALAHVREDETPDDWALLQSNLGVSLLKIGQTEIGGGSIERAAAAFEAALRIRTRQADPLRWAQTSSNLATALWRIGQRSGDLAMIERALGIYRDVIREWTRERVPFDWASTQHNIGAVLEELGSARGDAGLLRQSIDAYGLAMAEQPRDSAPLYWASTQNNLGNAYLALARLERDADWLPRAIDAYRAALQERTRERAPLQWATTQNNLGNALGLLGERTGKPEPLKQAVEAYHAALEVRRIDSIPSAWAATRTNLALTLVDLGAYAEGETLYQAAATMFAEVMSVRTLDTAPLGYASAQSNRGRALRLAGETAGDDTVLAAAADAYRHALAVYESHGEALKAAGARTDLGVTLLALARQTRDRTHLAAATAALEAARRAYHAAGRDQYDDYFAERLAEAAALDAALP